VDNPQTESRDPLIFHRFVSRNTGPPLSTADSKSSDDLSVMALVVCLRDGKQAASVVVSN